MSTLADLRLSLEGLLDLEPTDASSDPSSTYLNSIINTSVRKVIRDLKPKELLVYPLLALDSVSGQNYITLPSANILKISKLWWANSSFRQLEEKTFEKLIDAEGPSNFFSSANTGTPTMFALSGSDASGAGVFQRLVFNKYFSSSIVGALQMSYYKVPTTLVNNTDLCELPTDYDDLVVFESAVKYYQKDDDTENRAYYEGKVAQEKKQLKINLITEDNQTIDFDPNYFVSGGNYPSIDVRFS